MDKAKNFGHEVSTCIVVRHLPRLNRSMNTSNGTNGSNSDIIDLHSDVPILNIMLNDNLTFSVICAIWKYVVAANNQITVT